ncbi:MAG: hypothetical protein KF699_12745 [Phycisphaeraceae bacterium]|nr:hypothetical protein [Phycisphaeraceae bacterium]MBX3406860.1 hypothetical protein [Phycisphaeraceae bacterium]
MDERIQGNIKEGAGLDESRLNQDFIDWLRKWSTPILVVVAVLAGGYFLYGKYRTSRDAAMARAFAEYDAAVTSRNPASLLRVADEQSGKAAVPHLARLAAADLYLEAARTGIPAGMTLDPMGVLPDGVEFLTDAQKAEQLAKAAEQYGAVAQKTTGNRGMALHAIGALYGLASVAESRSEFDKAREHYTRLAEVATAAGFTIQAAAAKKRIETLDELRSMPRLYAQGEIWTPPIGATPIQVRTADGDTVTIDPTPVRSGTFEQTPRVGGGSDPATPDAPKQDEPDPDEPKPEEPKPAEPAPGE